MLTRLHIDNFLCFVNFEHRPGRRELILGGHGSGKSSFLEALLFLRQFVSKGNTFDDHFILQKRTRWLDQRKQTWELEAVLNEDKFVYRLEIETWGDPVRPKVHSETLHLDGKPIFEFVEGEVRLYDNQFEHKVTYPFDWNRSALATIVPRGDNIKVSEFKEWISSLYCFRINPFRMESRAKGEDLYPHVDLANIAEWYRHLLQAHPEENAALLQSLKESMDRFRLLRLDAAGENVRLLTAVFSHDAGASEDTYYFHELSDGQRCLVCLYTILHFVVPRGSTVVLDEPDNFVSLREIQPWLTAIADVVDKGRGQVLLISHHPEAINQWAPSNAVRFVRENAGAVKVVEFHGDPDGCLAPAELVARGWEDE